jgi:hypothetical protein
MTEPRAPDKKRLNLNDLLRIVLDLLVILVATFLIRDSIHTGTSRFFSMLAIIQSSVIPANRAVIIAPSDPEAHYTRGLALLNDQKLDEALVELREATRLRPYHYYEWLDLGLTLDRLGDLSGAEKAMRRSIALAPSFAQPHWQLGNMLFRSERYPEAFDELRQGATSNPNLAQGLFRLAWLYAKGDVSVFLAVIRPGSQQEHIDAGLFLATQAKGQAAAAEVRQAGEPDTEEQRGLLRQTITQLLSTKDYDAAFDVWRLTHPRHSSAVPGRIVNGDFTEAVLRDDPGFGWQLQDVANASFSISVESPSAGKRSLCIDFSGADAPSATLLSQTVLVQPGKHYSLSFMAKARDLITGGSPMVTVLTKAGDADKILVQSPQLSAETTDWIPYHAEFWTDDMTRVVSVILQRRQCSQAPCPVFGKLWLSQFELSGGN